MTTLFVVNPNCRNGDGSFGEILDALSPLGAVATHTIGQDGKLEDRLSALGGLVKRIVIGGGDGTLNCTLPLALETGVPVGVIPLGTANDFARSLNLPKNPVAAAELIAAGHTRRVDIGIVDGHYFLNAVGIGLGPELTKNLDREQKKRLGVLAYLENLIQVVGRRSRRFATITVDGKQVRSPFIQITIANGRHYGGGMMVSDEVEMDDGLLHMLCVQPLTPWEMFVRGLRIRFGAVKDDQKLIYLKGRKVQVETHRQADVTADGELITTTPIKCRSLNRMLEVYVPEEDAESRDDSAWEQESVAKSA